MGGLKLKSNIRPQPDALITYLTECTLMLDLEGV